MRLFFKFKENTFFFYDKEFYVFRKKAYLKGVCLFKNLLHLIEILKVFITNITDSKEIQRSIFTICKHSMR